MIGSNEKDWNKYNKVDPEEGINCIRGCLFMGCVMAVIAVIMYVVLT